MFSDAFPALESALCIARKQPLGERLGFSNNGRLEGMSAPRIDSKIAIDSDEYRARFKHNAALAERLRRLQDPAERRILGAEARAVAERRSLETMTGEFLEAYRSLGLGAG